MKAQLQPCPKCDAPLDGCQGLDEAHTPRPGDYTICIYCGEVWRFGEGLALCVPKHIPEYVQIKQWQLKPYIRPYIEGRAE